MITLKRIFAIISIFILVSLYVIGFVAVILNKSYALELLYSTTAISAVLSVIIYMFSRFHLMATKHTDKEKS